MSKRDMEYQNLKKEVDIINKELNSSLDLKSISKKWRFEDEETSFKYNKNSDLHSVLK